MSSQPSILVIDDEPNNFDVIEALLSHEGYQLHYTISGQRALTLLDSFQPDIILLDVMMPEISGIEVCRQIKAMPQWQAVPIIMITALTAKEDLANCLDAGADDFISKPVNGMELRARVRSMLRIKQQYDNAQTLLKLREDMVNMIVHDLRNPLASIVIATDILRIPGLSFDKQQTKLDQIAIASQQLQSLIDSLLAMAKLQSGKMILSYSEIDLELLCLSALDDIVAIADQKNLTLVRELPELGQLSKFDAAIIRRVVDNLLSNAIKFSPRNSTVLLRLEYPAAGGAKIQVADSGPGIRKDLRKSIFEKYETGSLIQEVSQIGLGLAFCKIAIEAHHGRITVEDNYPQGTIFSVFL